MATTNRLLDLANRAVDAQWDEERSYQELVAHVKTMPRSRQSVEEIKRTLEAIGSYGVRLEVARWIDFFIGGLQTFFNAGDPVAGSIQLNLAIAWLCRAEVGEFEAYQMVVNHCQAARRWVAADHPDYPELQRLEALATPRANAQVLAAHAHRLLQLATRVEQGEVSLSWAVQEVQQPTMLSAIDEDTLDALDGGVVALSMRDRQLAFILAILHDALASHAPLMGPLVQAHCALRVGQVGLGLGVDTLVKACLDRALVLYDSQGSRRGRANTLLHLGRWQQYQAQYDQALWSYQQAVEVYKELGGDPRQGQAHVLHSMGTLYQLQSQYDEALRSYQEALQLYGPETVLERAHVLRDIGTLHQRQSQYDEALARYQAAVQLYGQTEAVLGPATVLMDIAQIHEAQEEYPLALETYQRALHGYQAAQDPQGQAHAGFAMGRIHEAQEEYPLALETYQRALHGYQALNDLRGQARVVCSLGELYLTQGGLRQAQHTLEEALRLCQESGDRETLIATWLALGDLWRREGQFAKAYEVFSCALEAFEEMRGAQQRATTRRTLSHNAVESYRAMITLCLDQGWWDKAWHWVERSKGRALLDLLGEKVRPRLTTEQQPWYDTWQRQAHHVRTLEAQLEQLDRSDDPPTDLTEGRQRLQEARQEELHLRHKVADLLETGRELVQVDVPAPEALGLALQQLALPQPTGRRSLLVEYYLLSEDRYGVFMLPLWELSPGTPLPLVALDVQANWQRALDIFQAGTIAARQGFPGHARGEMPAEALAADEPVVQLFQRLASDQPAVYGPYVAEVLLYRGARLPSKLRNIARQTALDAFESLPQALGQAFMQPWAAHLAEWDPTDLILVPHGPLHRLPLHAAALPDGQPLITQYPLVYLPSAALAPMLLRRRQAALHPQECLVMGPPAIGNPPFAEFETGPLATRLGLSKPYAEDQMRVHVLREHAGRLQLAHLATHSVFDDHDYLQSYIKFAAQERLTLFELISEAQFNFQGMRLFYLSSCDSGIAKIDVTDELHGLVWALVYAGSQAVMASLWPVHSQAAVQIACTFYDAWQQPGTSLMQAYQSTLRQLCEPLHSKWRNPYYWAPFVVFGDGTSHLEGARRHGKNDSLPVGL